MDLDFNRDFGYSNNKEYWANVFKIGLPCGALLSPFIFKFLNKTPEMPLKSENKAKTEQISQKTTKPTRESKMTMKDLDSRLDTLNVPIRLPIHDDRVYVTAFLGDGRGHDGIDLQTPDLGREGVYSPVNKGVVTKAVKWGHNRGYGHQVIIRKIMDKDTMEFLQNHLGRVFVDKGDTVYQTDVLGKVGKTGRVNRINRTGEHLHWSVKKNGRIINPLDVISEIERELLLKNTANINKIMAGSSNNVGSRRTVKREKPVTYTTKNNPHLNKFKARKWTAKPAREWDRDAYNRIMQQSKAKGYDNSKTIDKFFKGPSRNLQSIILVSGHEEKKGGFYHKESGTHEWDITKPAADEIARQIRNDPAFRDVRLYYLNENIPIKDVKKRVSKANWIAQRNRIPINNQIFLSIHFNEADSKDAKGALAIKSIRSKNPRSYQLAACLVDEVDDYMGRFDKGVFNDKTLRGKLGEVYVLKNTLMPAVMLEGGFVSNSTDFRKLKQIQRNPRRYAQEVVQGLKAFMNGRTYTKFGEQKEGIEVTEHKYRVAGNPHLNASGARKY